MAAIAAVIRMKCVRLQPAAQSRPEIVDLEEQTSNLTSESNAHIMPPGNFKPAVINGLVIDNPLAKGAFVKGASYSVAFTLLTT